MPIAQKTGSSSQAKKEIPETVKLKLLLASAGIRDWDRKMKTLQDKNDLVAISEMYGAIVTTPSRSLKDTPLVMHKRSQFAEQKPEQLDDFLQKINDLQPKYESIFSYLTQKKSYAYYQGKKEETEAIKKEAGSFSADLQQAILAQ